MPNHPLQFFCKLISVNLSFYADEIFHAAVVVASILHFAAVRSVVNAMKAATCAP